MLHILIEALGGPMGWVVVSIIGIVVGCLIPLSAIWSNERKGMALIDLKRRMLEQGMSADEIARAVGVGEPTGVDHLPVACEAIVERSGEWCPAYVLKSAPGRFFVHYIGEDVTENEWVESRRVRLPALDGHDGPLARVFAAPNGKPPVEAEV
jgi:hypothetical protein